MESNHIGQQVPTRKKQGRRQRQRSHQDKTVKPIESSEPAEDIRSLVQAAFGKEGSAAPSAMKGKSARIPVNSAKAPQQPLQTKYRHPQSGTSYSQGQAQAQARFQQQQLRHSLAETSEEEKEEEEEEEQQQEEEEEEQQQEKEDMDKDYSEEEEMQPDPEVQARSNQELSEIRRNLEGLAEELDQILKGVLNKKKILLTEENLTKAMIKIDAVDSGGDDSIRKQRKDLINRAESLLVKVDEFKHRTKTTVPQKKA